jgi:hypothetical protein
MVMVRVALAAKGNVHAKHMMTIRPMVRAVKECAKDRFKHPLFPCF